MSAAARAAALLLLALASVTIASGSYQYRLANGTITMSQGPVRVYYEGSLVAEGIAFPGRAELYAVRNGSYLAAIIANASYSNVSAKFYVQPYVGGYTAYVQVCVNGSNATLSSVWQGGQQEASVPGLQLIVSAYNASCGELVRIYGNSTEFSYLTYFTESSWTSFDLRGSGWYMDVIVGMLSNSSPVQASVVAGAPPIIISSGAARSHGGLSSVGYVLLIISLASLLISLVAERGHR